MARRTTWLVGTLLGRSIAGGSARQCFWLRAGLAIPDVKEDLAMGEREQAPDSRSGESQGQDPEVLDEAREGALMREIMRRQERHREGGIDPELDERDEEARPEV
jgi:hypothetical protein